MARPEGPKAESISYKAYNYDFNLYGWHALKGQKLLAQGSASKQYALKGQKLLAQGIALGIMPICKSPCFTLIEQALSAFFNVNYV